MKLDRNINPSGICKYALVLIRKLHPLTQASILQSEGQPLRAVTIDSEALDSGKAKPFFVLRLQDRFAEPALRAYADAVRNEACRAYEQAIHHGQAALLSADEESKAQEKRFEEGCLKASLDLGEYAEEIDALALQAESISREHLDKLPD